MVEVVLSNISSITKQLLILPLEATLIDYFFLLRRGHDFFTDHLQMMDRL
jgi:hypothetical protein